MSDPSSNPLQALSASLTALVEQSAPSVVSVQSHRSLANGFALHDGLVVTADEALAEEGEVAVTLLGGERRSATVVGRDPSTDIALLRVDGAGPPGVSLDAGTPAVGSLALAIGARHDAALAAFGVVSLVGPEWRSMRGGRIDARIELDLGLRREAEGSLVVDVGGNALGMAVFGPRRRVLLIPAATIKRVAAALERDGRIRRGYLGLSLQPVRVGAGGKGAMVMAVDDHGPGAAAGVRQGDVIVAWDGKPLPGISALLRALGPESVGRAVTIALHRGGEPTELTLTIGERAAA
jgi:S1-C subfamily serine protease